MKLSGRLLSCLILANFALAGATLEAQELRGRITGVVKDNSGSAVPGVSVTATSAALIQPQTTTSASDGVYTFPALPSGVYTLTFELTGFRTVKREGIRAQLNTTLTIDASMEVASIAEAITITGESPTVDVKTNSIGTSFTKELLTDIPNARDVWAAMAQAPGFQMQAYDVGGSHTGTQTGYMTYGVGDQNKTMIEGINVTEGTAANAGYFDFGSFEEFQLGGAGNMGEQAGPGALLNITVKRGGDKFSGQIYADYEGDSTIADNVPDVFKTANAVGPDGFSAPAIRDPATGIVGGLARGNPITKQYDLNVGLGGPIIKGKLWFYAGYRLNNQFKTILGLPGTEAQSKLDNKTAKLTFQINPKNQLIAFYNQRTKLQPLRDLSLTTPVEAAYYQASTNRPIKVEWTSVLTDRLFLDLQYSHWYNAFPLYPTKTGSADTSGVGPGRIDLATNQLAGANQAYQDQFRYKPQVAGSLSYSKDNWAGSHSFKFGFEWLRDRKQFGSLQPADIFYRDRAGVISEVDIWNTPNMSINDAVQTAVFLQDSWSISRRVTLNLGARYDRYALGWPDQSFTPNQTAYFQPVSVAATDVVTLSSITPRLGIAWDLTGKGKTVLKAFVGKYAYNPSADVADRENPVGGAQRRYQFVPCSATRTTQCDLNNNRLVDSPAELGNFLQTLGGAGFVKIDRNIESPYGLEISTHLEHELFPSLSVRGSYVYKATRNEWAEVDLGRYDKYTVPFNFTDVGPDARAGTADDQVLALRDLQPGTTQNRVYTTPGNVPGLPSYDGNYHTVEFAVNRRLKDRWMFLTSFEHTWADAFTNPAQSTTSALGIVRQATAYLYRPNQRNFGDSQKTSYWNGKLLARYEFPWQLSVAGSFKLQSGFNWARSVSVPLPTAGAETVFTEPANANRAPNVPILDIRLEKAFKLAKIHKVTFMADCFNVTNANTVTNFRITTGATYKQLLALLDPRIFRFGVRYDF